MVPDANVTAFAKCLVDLKTAASADPSQWGREVRRWKYDWQAALYLDLYTKATGEDRTDFLHVVVENEWPYATGKMLLSQEFIELARAEYLDALKTYAFCLARKEWPGYSAGQWTIVQPEPWMMTATAREPVKISI
jgi:hypothetical protein